MSLKNLISERHLATVRPDMSVMDAIKEMVERRIGAVIVAENDKLVGMFSERDVMKEVALGKRDPAATKVSEIMTTKVVTISMEASVHDSVELMRKHHIRHLPIVQDGGELVGIVSLRDLLWDINRDLENQAAALAAYMGADGPGG